MLIRNQSSGEKYWSWKIKIENKKTSGISKARETMGGFKHGVKALTGRSAPTIYGKKSEVLPKDPGPPDRGGGPIRRAVGNGCPGGTGPSAWGHRTFACDDDPSGGKDTRLRR